MVRVWTSGLVGHARWTSNSRKVSNCIIFVGWLTLYKWRCACRFVIRSVAVLRVGKGQMPYAVFCRSMFNGFSLEEIDAGPN